MPTKSKDDNDTLYRLLRIQDLVTRRNDAREFRARKQP